MPNYQRTNFAFKTWPYTPPSPVHFQGLKPGLEKYVQRLLDTASRQPALNRRQVMHFGAHGQSSWHVPGTNPHDTTAPLTRTHPPPDLVRPVAWAKFDLTPGCLLRADILYAPAGETQEFFDLPEPGDQMNAGGVFGKLIIDITWEAFDGTGSTSQTVINMDGSNRPYGAAGSGSDHFAELRTASAFVIQPNVDLSTETNKRRWSRHCHVEVTVSYQGSPRVVDFTLSETPWTYFQDLDVDTTHVTPVWSPAPGETGPSIGYPRTRILPTDERGQELAHEAAENVWDLCGPLLVAWNAYDESTLDVGGDGNDNTSYTPPGFLVTNNSVGRQIPNNRTPAPFPPWGAGMQGWSANVGAYARHWHGNAFGLDNDGTIPVIVRALVSWGSSSSTADGLVRVYAGGSASSYIDIAVPSPNAQGVSRTWLQTFGHLGVGRGCGQDLKIQGFLYSNTDNDPLTLHALYIEHAGYKQRADQTP